MNIKKSIIANVNNAILDCKKTIMNEIVNLCKMLVSNNSDSLDEKIYFRETPITLIKVGRNNSVICETMIVNGICFCVIDGNYKFFFAINCNYDTNVRLDTLSIDNLIEIYNSLKMEVSKY